MAVTYTQALLDRATAYLTRSVSERRYDEGLSEIAQLLSDITGEPNGGCRQCQYADYFTRVRAYITQATRFLHPETMSTSTHQLKPEYANETFVHESYGKPVVGGEMTAEDAAFFQKHYPHAFSDSAQPGASQSTTTGDSTDTDKGSPEPTEGEKKAQAAAEKATEGQKKAEAAAEKHKQEVADGKKALKAGKDAHAATGRELADLKKVLATTETQLREAQARLDKGPDAEATDAK